MAPWEVGAASELNSISRLVTKSQSYILSSYQPPSLVRNDKVINEVMPEDFYYTDAINDEACQMIEDACDNGNNNPFFLYVAHTAPHWPLHAPQGRAVCLFIK